MSGIIHANFDALKTWRRGDGNHYDYEKRPVIPDGASRHCAVSFYQLAPGKSNYPYHYHLDQEEVFYIISGQGVLKTPEGEKAVQSGDLLFFPAGESGAHKLTNTSADEPLRYIDFDTIAAMDVAVYPDSQKVGIWSPTLNKVFRLADKAHYYDGEDEAEK